MQCVYSAFADHLRHIGEPEYVKVQEAFYHFKSISHDGNPNQYTFAGIVPWLYWQLLFEHNLHSRRIIEMQIQRSYLHPAEYMPEATQVQREIMMRKTQFWGQFVDKVDLRPAIYCMFNEQHALFAETVPDYPGARILFAVRLLVAHPDENNGGQK